MVRISFQYYRFIAPNCGGADSITITFDLTDADGNTGSTRIIGTKTQLQYLSDNNFLAIDGLSGSSNFATPYGNISVLDTYDAGFNIAENITVEMNIEDCEGWRNIDAALGFTNAIMTHNDEYLMDHTGDFLAFIK